MFIRPHYRKKKPPTFRTADGRRFTPNPVQKDTWGVVKQK